MLCRLAELMITQPGPKVGYLMTDNGFLLLDHVRMLVFPASALEDVLKAELSQST